MKRENEMPTVAYMFPEHYDDVFFDVGGICSSSMLLKTR
jgi:hypothetical protein